MKLEQAFYSLQERNPYWSSYTCLANAVMGRNYGKMAIGQAFQKCVEKDDYSRSEKEGVIKFLCLLTDDKKQTLLTRNHQ
jgi:hypothetical protein